MEKTKAIASTDKAGAESFTRLLNLEPNKKEIATNKMANNSRYIPISFVEMLLDEMFFGLWQTKNFQSSVIANEIVGQIELGVYHPVLNEWIWRTGTGAAMIQQKRGASITDLEAKGKNTLVKDYPHLKAECIKNAARSLGKRFGRDLNRTLSDDYNPLTETVKEAKSLEEKIKEELDLCSNVSQLQSLMKNNPKYQSNDVIINMFMERQKQLSKAS